MKTKRRRIARKVILIVTFALAACTAFGDEHGFDIPEWLDGIWCCISYKGGPVDNAGLIDHRWQFDSSTGSIHYLKDGEPGTPYRPSMSNAGLRVVSDGCYHGPLDKCIVFILATTARDLDLVHIFRYTHDDSLELTIVEHSWRGTSFAIRRLTKD